MRPHGHEHEFGHGYGRRGPGPQGRGDFEGRRAAFGPFGPPFGGGPFGVAPSVAGVAGVAAGEGAAG